MRSRQASFLTAFLTLIGTIIGAGVFGIPAVMQKVGIVTGTIVFLAVALVILSTHLLYIEIISRDRTRRRLPGYAGEILGKWAEKVAAVTHTLHLTGASLAYLILGGDFLAVIANRFGLFDGLLMWQILFWVGGVAVVVAGLKILADIESSLTWMLLAVMIMMIILAIPQARAEQALLSNWSEAHTILGIFIFSLSGFTVMPEIFELTGKNVGLTRRVVLVATLMSALLTWLFGISINLAGTNLDLASPASLNVLFPVGVWWLLPVFGFLAVATSFITSTFDLQAMFAYDLKLSRPLALCLTLGLPLALLLVTSRNYISTIETVGSLLGAANGLLVVVVAAAAMKMANSRQPIWWRIVVPVGVAATFIFTFVQRLAQVF